MAYFQALTNRRVIAEFNDPWDIEAMQNHPEYIQVNKDGTPVKGKPKTDQREPWQMPLTRISPGKGSK